MLMEVSHSGQLRRFAKPDPFGDTWVRIPPPPQELHFGEVWEKAEERAIPPPPPGFCVQGGVPEWTNGLVLKTSVV